MPKYTYPPTTEGVADHPDSFLGILASGTAISRKGGRRSGCQNPFGGIVPPSLHRLVVGRPIWPEDGFSGIKRSAEKAFQKSGFEGNGRHGSQGSPKIQKDGISAFARACSILKSFGSFFLQSVCLSNHPNGPDSSPLVFHFSGLDLPIGFRISLRINPKSARPGVCSDSQIEPQKTPEGSKKGDSREGPKLPRQVGEFAKIGFEEFGELRRGVFLKALQLTFASVIHRACYSIRKDPFSDHTIPPLRSNTVYIASFHHSVQNFPDHANE